MFLSTRGPLVANGWLAVCHHGASSVRKGPVLGSGEPTALRSSPLAFDARKTR